VAGASGCEGERSWESKQRVRAGVLDEFVRQPFSPGGTAPEQIIRPLFQGACSVGLSEGEGNGRQSGRIEGRDEG